jgi:hypothetical protein
MREEQDSEGARAKRAIRTCTSAAEAGCRGLSTSAKKERGGHPRSVLTSLARSYGGKRAIKRLEKISKEGEEKAEIGLWHLDKSKGV